MTADAAIDNTAYGILAFSNDQPALTNSIVRFDLVSDQEPTFARAVSFSTTSTAGAFANDCYYMATTRMSGSKEVPANLVKFNLETGSSTQVGVLQGYENLINDMTFDNATQTMYAVSRISDSQSGLFAINLTTGASTRVADLDRRFFTLAATYAGQLYGISFAGEFCSINKASGEVTVVGHTGHYPERFQSMSFDHSDETLYWIASTRRLNESGTIEISESFVATINTETGAVTRHQNFGDNQLAGLYIPAFAAAANCPAPVVEPTVVPAAAGESAATLSWTNPTRTFGGETLKSITRVEIARGGRTVGVVTDAQPGAVSSFKDVIADEAGAEYAWTIVAYNNNGAGAAVRVSAFVGRDVPASVGAVNVEKLTPNSARVYWPAVNVGVNGGWTDTEGMTYDVVRNPGEVTVAQGLTATEWFEPGVAESGTYTYTVTARNSCGTSEPTVSAPVILGPKLSVPYSCGFDEDFGQWTPVDANADGNTWVRFNLAWAKADGAYFNSTNCAGDDWLISNTMELEPNSTYKVGLRCMASGNHPLKFYLLKDSDTAAPLQAAGSLDLSRSWSIGPVSFTFETGENIGDCNFAIHNGAEAGNSYLIIDDITIEKLVDCNLAATSVTGNAKPIEGNAYVYTVNVVNKGLQACSSYTVELTDAEGSRLASVVVDEPLAPEASANIAVEYEFPVGSTLTAVYGRVSVDGDAVVADNTTAPLALSILPVGSPEEILIGQRVSNGYYHPMNLYSKYGASLNIYAAYELAVKRGRITGIKFDVTSSTSAAQNIGVKIYMANTDRTKAADGWIPEEEMTLVYDGTFDVAKGANTPEFTFDHAFEYTGSNLALLTVTSLENAGTSYLYTQQPYYNSPLPGNNAVTYGGNEPFSFSGNPYARSGNSVITLAIQSGGASVTGVVTDSEGNPVEGATVRIAEIRAETTTDANGSYRFDFVPNADYTVGVSMFGYESQEPVHITIADADATADLVLTKLPVYTVSGRVIAPDGSAVENAKVSLSGYSAMEAMTGADGTFEFADAVTAAEAAVAVEKAWYNCSEVSFALTENKELGDISLDYARFAPVNVAAEESESGIGVSWDAPSATATLSYDSGVPATQVGFMESVGTIVIGTAFRTPMTLTGVSWFTTSEGGPHYTVNVYVYDLDDEGNPTGNIIYSKRSVSNTDGQWSSLSFDEAVEAPRGCFVAVNYPGFLGLGVDSAPRTNPAPDRTYAFSTEFSSGDFMYFEPGSLSGNLMIRAEGNPWSAEGVKAAVSEPLPAHFSYNLRRSKGYDSSEWTLVNESPVGETELVDNGWQALPAGVYRYAVTSVFPDGSESAPVMTGYLPHDMLGSISLTVATNSFTGNATGAEVTLTSVEEGTEYEATVNGSDKIEFGDIWRGNYVIDIALGGYEFKPVEVSLVENRNVELNGLELEEIIATPVNVVLNGDLDGGFRLSWNESGEIFDDFESHVPFTAESAGEVGWMYRDADGGRTFAEPEFDFPGRTQPCSFMVFNPWLTTPNMAEKRTLAWPHSGKAELACFAGYTGSDDWFISPRLNYHDDFKFSFYALGYSSTYGEVIRIGYSTTDTVASSFTWIGDEVEVVKQQWVKYEYDIPAEARYVALNSISPDGFMLFVDDVTISSGSGLPMNTAVSGPDVKYVVMLDGEKVAETSGTLHAFENVGCGMHTASVKAVYASGESEAVTVEFGQDGLNEIGAGGSLTVAPNPAPGYTEVTGGDFESAQLYDLSGRRVAVFGGNDPRLDLSRVAPGVYLLSVKPVSGKPVTVKLVVM